MRSAWAADPPSASATAFLFRFGPAGTGRPEGPPGRAGHIICRGDPVAGFGVAVGALAHEGLFTAWSWGGRFLSGQLGQGGDTVGQQAHADAVLLGAPPGASPRT